MRSDLLVLGAGPAGLALAGDAAARGLTVACIDPAPAAPWAHNFGMWAVEADLLRARAPVEARWPHAIVELGDMGRFELDAAYCRVDVPELQRRLIDDARGVALECDRAVAVEPDACGARVRLASGATLEADLVVDATGAQNPWIRRGSPRAVAYQVAYGQLLEVDAHPYAEGEMTLMDFRPIPGERALPTFLYALPLGPRLLFVEETSLVARPAVTQAELAARLQARLRVMGIAPRRTVADERCTIAMGAPLPLRDQPVLAFGAAGGMVHPATGYQLARALGDAPRVADALAGPGDRAARVAAAHDIIWPAARRRAWELYTFGMEALLRLDANTIRSFFRSFFQLRPATWLPYLRGTATPAAIAWLMLNVLARSSGSARRELWRLDATQGRSLLRAFAGAPS